MVLQEYLRGLSDGGGIGHAWEESSVLVESSLAYGDAVDRDAEFSAA